MRISLGWNRKSRIATIAPTVPIAGESSEILHPASSSGSMTWAGRSEQLASMTTYPTPANTAPQR
jgi:hypothetical protein